MLREGEEKVYTVTFVIIVFLFTLLAHSFLPLDFSYHLLSFPYSIAAWFRLLPLCSCCQIYVCVYSVIYGLFCLIVLNQLREERRHVQSYNFYHLLHSLLHWGSLMPLLRLSPLFLSFNPTT